MIYNILKLKNGVLYAKKIFYKFWIKSTYNLFFLESFNKKYKFYNKKSNHNLIMVTFLYKEL